MRAIAAEKRLNKSFVKTLCFITVTLSTILLKWSEPFEIIFKTVTIHFMTLMNNFPNNDNSYNT
jgi:hypothetical protein